MLHWLAAFLIILKRGLRGEHEAGLEEVSSVLNQKDKAKLSKAPANLRWLFCIQKMTEVRAPLHRHTSMTFNLLVVTPPCLLFGI